jgi:hypothetical protein
LKELQNKTETKLAALARDDKVKIENIVKEAKTKLDKTIGEDKQAYE